MRPTVTTLQASAMDLVDRLIAMEPEPIREELIGAVVLDHAEAEGE